MQTSCWRLTGLVALLWVLMLSGPPAQGAVLQSGIHGMAWGEHAITYPRLEKVREAGDVSYYVDRKMAYHVVGQPLSPVVYGFYRDQLFAAYIKLSSPNQAYYLEKHFSTEYGPSPPKDNPRNPLPCSKSGPAQGGFRHPDGVRQFLKL